jgi:hypothetical protein
MPPMPVLDLCVVAWSSLVAADLPVHGPASEVDVAGDYVAKLHSGASSSRCDKKVHM